MPKFVMHFTCDNAAFENDAAREISRILQVAHVKVLAGHESARVFDVNGNIIGEWSVDLPERQEDDAA